MICIKRVGRGTGLLGTSALSKSLLILGLLHARNRILHGHTYGTIRMSGIF